METEYGTPMTIKAEFNKLDTTNRSDLLQRCEKYAGWTLPTIFPEFNAQQSTEMQMDYQSLGAQAVNHLSNKLVFALFNPSRPFFKLEATSGTAEKLETFGIKQGDVQLVFSKAEKDAMTSLLKRRIRANIVQTMKHLIITGNALFYVPPNGDAVQVYSLRDYVIKRDLSGNTTLLITRDLLVKETLRDVVGDKLNMSDEAINALACDQQGNVTLYTRIEYKDEKFHVTQAIEDNALAVNDEYTKENTPWIPLVWNLPRGWSYGVGLVEEYAGTFHAISGLTEALVNGGIVAADLKYLVDPTGVADAATLNAASNGDYVAGRDQDINIMQVENGNNLQIVQSILEKLERRIGQAFLLNSAVTRDAERVTAQEIRIQAQELETSLGGVYSTLADDFQNPLAYLTLKDIDFNVEGKGIDPLVITGMDALQRGNDADNMMLFLQDMAMLGQLPPELLQRMNLEEFSKLMAANRNVEYNQFIKSDAQMQQEQMQQQSMQQPMQQPVQ